MKKLVLDTNVLISGYLFGGKPNRLIEAALREKIYVYSSDALLDEFARIASGKFKVNPGEVRRTVRIFRQMFEVVNSKTIPHMFADVPDNQVLAICHQAKIEAIVTGDKAILDLGHYRGAKVLTVSQFLDEYELSMDDI